MRCFLSLTASVAMPFSFLLLMGCGSSSGGALPEVTSIFASNGKPEGPVIGETPITIRGANFGSDTLVSFGANPSLSVTVQNSTTLIATTGPVFRSGSVSVTVKTGGQIAIAPEAFFYAPIVVFSSNSPGNFEIFTMAIDGTELRQVTNFFLGFGQNPSPGEINASPTFSPDGKEIVFSSNRTGSFNIFITGRTGTDSENLTNSSGNNQNPSFSPDGTLIVFSSDRVAAQDPAGDFEIFRMDRTGGNVTPLTANPADDTDPAYSPDGRRIVFVSNRNGADTDLFMMDSSDGGNLMQLTTNTDNDDDPVFSPDGSQILFVSGPPGARELFVISSGGGSPTPLTSSQGTASDPAYVTLANNKMSLLFTRNTMSGDDEIFTMACQGTGFVTSCDENATNISLRLGADNSPSPSP